MPKSQIFDRLWGFDSDTNVSVVEVYVSKIRKKLKGTDFATNLQTLRSGGIFWRMLTKFFNYLFRRIKSDGFKSFIHLFATFSGIFLIMTVMILQILSYGVYSNVDSSLKAAVTKTNSYLEMEMLKREFFLTSDVDQNNTATIYQEYDSKAYR